MSRRFLILLTANPAMAAPPKTEAPITARRRAPNVLVAVLRNLPKRVCAVVKALLSEAVFPSIRTTRRDKVCVSYL